MTDRMSHNPEITDEGIGQIRSEQCSFSLAADVVRSHLTWIIVIAVIYSLVITAAVIIQWIF